MKEHPILFSTPMVQAILEGRKTQTRRIVKKDIPQNVTTIDRYNKTGQFTLWDNRRIVSQIGESPYGKPGDLLWVRETWAKPLYTYFFKAEYSSPVLNRLTKGTWRPSIHMPKVAARIWLQIEEVKVERLQHISEEDIISEGVRIPVSEDNKVIYQLGVTHSALSFLPDGCFADGMPTPTQKQVLTAFFTELWVKINGIESWHENPWVWVVKFKVLSTTGKPEFN